MTNEVEQNDFMSGAAYPGVVFGRAGWLQGHDREERNEADPVPWINVVFRGSFH